LGSEAHPWWPTILGKIFETLSQIEHKDELDKAIAGHFAVCHWGRIDASCVNTLLMRFFVPQSVGLAEASCAPAEVIQLGRGWRFSPALW
jgi:hypothetical protein